MSGQIECPCCGTFFKKFIFQRHFNVCKKLHDNQLNLFNDYKQGENINQLSTKYNIEVKQIRLFFRKNGVKILKSRNLVNHNFFNEETEEMYWLLGLIASDGCVCNNKTWSIAQNGEKGKLLIEYVKKILNHTNKITRTKTLHQDCYQISITSPQMVSSLKKMGIQERKTFLLRFPQIKNESYLKAFIRGYIDGDGSIGIYKNKTSEYLCLSFVGNHDFIKGAKKLIPFSSFCYKKGNVSDIRWHGEQAVIFGDWLYENENLYQHWKVKLFKDYIFNTSTYPRWSVTNFQKETFFKEIYKTTISSSEIRGVANKIGVFYKTIYAWRNASPPVIKRIGKLYCNLSST